MNRIEWLIEEIEKMGLDGIITLLLVIVGLYQILQNLEKTILYTIIGLVGLIILKIFIPIILRFLVDSTKWILSTLKNVVLFYWRLPKRIQAIEDIVNKGNNLHIPISKDIKIYKKTDFSENELIVLRRLSHWEHEIFKLHFISLQNKINVLSGEIGLSREETMKAVNLLFDKKAVNINHPLSPESYVQINGNFAIINKELFLSINK